MIRFLVPAFAVFNILAVKEIVAMPFELEVAETIFLPFNINVSFSPAIDFPFISLSVTKYFPP